MKLTQFIKDEIIKLKEQNLKPKEIIDTLHISKATYYRVIKEINDNKSIIPDTENKDIPENETKNESSSSYTSNDTQTSDSETQISNSKVFNVEQFKNDLNNNLNTESENDIEVPEIIVPVNTPLPETQIPETKFNDISNISVSFARNQPKRQNNNVSNIINKSNIIDVVRNVNVGSVEELKEKRSSIIIIRQ